VPRRLTALFGDAEWRRELTFVVTAVITAWVAPTAALKGATAGVLVVAFAAFLMLTRGPAKFQSAALIVSVAGGLASILLSHNGVGEAPVLLCAVYPRLVLPDVAGKVVTWLIGIAFGVAIGWIGRSPAGLLAGLGVPVLALRRQEQFQLRQEHDRALTLLAELEAARDAQALAAALEERGRIAREMHDVLAHSLSGLSLQLQATRAVAQREGVGPAVMEPLERAAELARSGVEEAKAVVGALRGTAGDGATRGLGDLPTLVERFPGAAALVVTGEPRQVDGAVGHAVYRAVQESLTNAARYAPGSPVRVALAWEPEQLQASIEDDGLATVR
jgi:signal transduction histidine kinase